MKNIWVANKLSEILLPVSRPITVNPMEEYRLLGVRLDGGGVFHRETKTGSQISATTLFRVQTGDFIYSRLFAWRGAFGVINPTMDKCYVSSEFPTFTPVEEKINIDFLRLWFLLPSTIGIVEADCSGSTPLTRNRFKEHFFLDLEIPLPSLEEQRRIVARIEELATRVEEARGLRKETVEETENILKEAEFQIWPDSSLDNAVPLEDVTTYLSRGRQSAQGDSTHFLIKTQHVQQGHYVKSYITLEPHIAMKVLPDAIVQPGDILIACSAAGCLGRVARFMETNQVASTDTHVAIARANLQVILPKYLYLYLEGSQGQIQLRSRERGDWTREKVGFRLTELNLADLKGVPVPLPSLHEQERIVNYLDGLQSKIDVLKRKQVETRAELDALLPSILDKAFRGELV